MIQKNIDTIIFDLGGVLFDIDYQLTIKAFENIGFDDFAIAYSKANQNNIFDLLETGKLSDADFYDYINQITKKNIPSDAINNAWNAMLIGMPSIKFETLAKLKSRFNLYLLSNTNNIHLPMVFEMIEQQTPGKHLDDYFIKTYYSNKIGLRKPDIESFYHVINDNGLKPQNTLFVDDSIQHIHGATAAGLNAIHIHGDLNTEKLFASFL
jgi:putative hydrolase of the HAD superfamily